MLKFAADVQQAFDSYAINCRPHESREINLMAARVLVSTLSIIDADSFSVRRFF